MPTVLESLLEPISPIEFREHYYGKQPLLIRGHAQKFAGLFTWDDFNRLLNASPHPHPHIEISRLGKRARGGTSDSVIDQCRAGASMIFREIQLFDSKLAELTHGVEAEIGEAAFISLVLSQPSHAAFQNHWDRNDGFILQVYGRKAWWVYGPPVDKPIVNFLEHLHEPPSDPVLECELAPGDVLYVPRGHWHHALAQGGLTLHLTLAVMARTGIDFLTWLVDQLRSDVRFRHELPLSFAQEPAELRAERLRDHIARLREILHSRLQDPATIEAFMRHPVEYEGGVRRFDFPAQLLDAAAGSD